VYPLLVVLVAVVVAFRVDHSASSAKGEPPIELRGTSDQRDPVTVTLDRRGRMQALATHITGLCENGRTWKIAWSPDSPRIPFRTGADGQTEVREVEDHAERRHTTEHVVAWTRARVSRSAASGDARMIATFTYPHGKRLTCDSGYVHWSAPTRHITSMPSLAVNPSRVRRAFAWRVDRACYDGIYQAETAVRSYAALLAAHRRQYRMVARLGPAPEAEPHYSSWLANVARRIALERLEFSQLARGKAWDAHLTDLKLAFLQVRGNALGQEFGLRICTMHGPVQPVPARKSRATA
jgi:hypothetical protein